VIFSPIDFGTFYKVVLNPAIRIGIDIGTGLHWNMKFLPVALEGSGSYLNANIIGKQFTQSPIGLNYPSIHIGLNDAWNPEDPTDHNRTIAYLSIKLGTRVWF
jgi:hypothetical protein